MRTEPFLATATYCEDVRQELFGTQTYVGVYKGALGVPSFPVTLAKFAIVVEAHQDRSKPPQDVAFAIVLRKDDGSLAEIELARDVLEFVSIVKQHPAQTTGRYHSVTATAAFPTLPLEGPSTIFVKFFFAGDEYVPPAIQFVLGQPAPAAGAP